MNENERDLIPTKLIGVMSTYLPKIYAGTNIKSYTMLCGYDIEFGRYESKEDMILKVLKSVIFKRVSAFSFAATAFASASAAALLAY